MQIAKISTNSIANFKNLSTVKQEKNNVTEKKDSLALANSLNATASINKALVFKGKSGTLIAEEFWPNGNKKSEKYSNGGERVWFENGQLQFVKKASGATTEFYETGRAKKTTLQDGTICEWFENGQKSKQETKDGTIETWFDNGQQYSLQTKSGALVIWNKNGELAVVKSSNGTLDTWGEGKRHTTHIIEKSIADTPIDDEEN